MLSRSKAFSLVTNNMWCYNSQGHNCCQYFHVPIHCLYTYCIYPQIRQEFHSNSLPVRHGSPYYCTHTIQHTLCQFIQPLYHFLHQNHISLSSNTAFLFEQQM